MLAPSKFTRTEEKFDLNKESKKVVIDADKIFIAGGTATGVNVLIFCYDF